MTPKIESILPEANIVRIDSTGQIHGDPTGIEVMLFSMSVTEKPETTAAVMKLMGEPSLRWLQSPGAGVDHPIWQNLLDRGVRLTNASGIHAEPIAQYIFTYILHWERQVAKHQDQQRAKHWEILRSGDLTARTLGIVGYGGIGQSTARVAKAFGMRVLATRRTPTPDPLLDRFIPLDNLPELLRESDYVVLCMPYSDETRNMIGAAELNAMGPDAVLINVARGGVVDEPKLIDALRERRIRGATLDVVSEEPLPTSSELWSLENCVLTSHDAGYSPCGDERLSELFLDNLERYAADKSMRNEVRSTGLSGI